MLPRSNLNECVEHPWAVHDRRKIRRGSCRVLNRGVFVVG